MLLNYFLITFNNSELDLSSYIMIIQFLESHNPKHTLLAAALGG